MLVIGLIPTDLPLCEFCFSKDDDTEAESPEMEIP